MRLDNGELNTTMMQNITQIDIIYRITYIWESRDTPVLEYIEIGEEFPT